MKAETEKKSFIKNLIPMIALISLNGLVFFGIFCAIKEIERDKEKKGSGGKNSSQQTELDRLREDAINVNSQISNFREQKLHDLNTTATETLQKGTVSKEVQVPVVVEKEIEVEKKSDSETKSS